MPTAVLTPTPEALERIIHPDSTHTHSVDCSTGPVLVATYGISGLPSSRCVPAGQTSSQIPHTERETVTASTVRTGPVPVTTYGMYPPRIPHTQSLVYGTKASTPIPYTHTNSINCRTGDMSTSQRTRSLDFPPLAVCLRTESLGPLHP